MFCEHCGTKNEDDAKFCTGCGKLMGESGGNSGVNNVTPQPGAGNPAGNGAAVAAAAKPAGNQQPNKSKALIPAIIGGCAAFVALIVVILIIVTAKPTIKLDDYLTFEVNGYDGYGRATVVIDWDGIEENYGDKLSFTSQVENTYGIITPMDTLKSCISVQLENTRELSNGDVIAYTWNVDEDLYTYVKCKTKYSDDSYTVAGLTEVGTFDAFADLEVTFSGISPNARLDYNYYGSQLSVYNFSCDNTYGLKNGDVVKFTITNSDIEYYAMNFGMIPISLEKEYVVSGLDEYVDSYEKLSNDFIAELKSETEDTIYAYVANSYNSTSSLAGLTYAGYILNLAKDGGNNELYIIYSGTVSNSEGRFTTSKVYFPVRFRNIVSGENGLSYESKDNNIVGRSSFDGSYSTNGYRNPITCYMELVETQRDRYTSECGDGFEAYAEYELIAGLDDISDEYKAILYADAKERIESYFATATGWYDAYGLNGTEVAGLGRLGEYLLLNKSQGTDFANNNKYIIVYAVDVSNSAGRFGAAKVYIPVEYDGIVKLPGGEYMTTTTVGITNNNVNFPNSSYRTRGYIDGSEMFTKLVTANRNTYTYELTEGLKQFGE